MLKHGLIDIGQDYGIAFAIEPDWRRLKDAPNWIWEAEDVVQIARDSNSGICMDTSHTIISNNALGSLFTTYEALKKAPGGVAAIHLSAAIPEANRESLHIGGSFGTKGAMPIDDKIPSAVRGVFREFYQHVKADPDVNAPIILEFLHF